MVRRATGINLMEGSRLDPVQHLTKHFGEKLWDFLLMVFGMTNGMTLKALRVDLFE